MMLDLLSANALQENHTKVTPSHQVLVNANCLCFAIALWCNRFQASALYLLILCDIKSEPKFYIDVNIFY